MRKSLLYLSFGLAFAIMVAGVLCYIGELQLHQDNARTRFNIKLVYKHLEQYHTEHGAYPVQQDMKTLLKTLDMKESDFDKVRFFDISSAEYHASNRNQEDSAQNIDDPVLSIRVKSRVFGKYERLCVRKDGSVYRDYNIETKP